MAAILLLFLCVASWKAFPAFSASPCPVDFSYVKTFFPSSCNGSPASPSADCCVSSFNTFGLAIAIYLRNFKAFEFPDNATVFSCFTAYEDALHRDGLGGFSVRACPSKFVPELFISSPFLCSGIQTVEEWNTSVGQTAMDSSCKGDLSSSAACEACSADVGNAISKVSSLSPNHSACFYYAVLYAAAIVNVFGPTNPATAGCLLASKATPARTVNSNHIVVFASVGAALALLLVCLLIAVIWFYLWRRRQLYHENFVRRNRKLLGSSLQPNVGAIWYKIDDIMDATNNFAAQNLIGEGGYATVYLGTLSDGSQVAIKKIKNCTPEGDLEFRNEVEVINRVRHRNLVVLRGCCVASNSNLGHSRLLIYGYMPNGSLEEYLFDGKKPLLKWPDRQKILLDAAKGITYLHTGIDAPIIHRDIKANNILLDEHLNAYVADFGLARVTAEGMTHMTTRVAGTQGYLAPEYALYGQLTEKSDVYSFGVLLLVVMSGRPALDVHDPYPLITDWAWVTVKRSSALDIVDERVRDWGVANVLERFVLVGILCAHLLVAFRPTMSHALKMLEGDMDVPEIPDRPLPLTHNFLSAMDNWSTISSLPETTASYSYKSEDLLR